MRGPTLASGTWLHKRACLAVSSQTPHGPKARLVLVSRTGYGNLEVTLCVHVLYWTLHAQRAGRRAGRLRCRGDTASVEVQERMMGGAGLGGLGWCGY